MGADWAWCSAPPAMADEGEKREFLRWRNWYLQRARDMLVNPLSVIELAIEQLERDSMGTPELREHVSMAREGQDALREAVKRLNQAVGTEEWK